MAWWGSAAQAMSSATALACSAGPSASAFIRASAGCGPTEGVQQVVAVSGDSWANSYASPMGGTRLTRPSVAATTSRRIPRLENLADITVGAASTTRPQNSVSKPNRKARALA